MEGGGRGSVHSLPRNVNRSVGSPSQSLRTSSSSANQGRGRGLMTWSVPNVLQSKGQDGRVSKERPLDVESGGSQLFADTRSGTSLPRSERPGSASLRSDMSIGNKGSGGLQVNKSNLGVSSLDITASDSSWSLGGSSTASADGGATNLDLTGFEQLENCSGMFSVKQTERLESLSEAIIWEMYFKIFNQRGQHILSAGEVKDSWYRFSHWEFCIYVFTSSGRPLFTISQRNLAQCSACNSGCNSGRSEERKIWLVQKEADDWLNQKAKLMADEDDAENRTHVHVSLISGAFLGHIWNGGDSFVIYDIEYNPVLSLVHRDMMHKNADDLELLNLPPPPPSPISSSEALRAEQHPPEGEMLYKIYVEATRIGAVHIDVNVDKFLEEKGHVGVRSPTSCLLARFPKDIEREDKILILAFLLFQQRHHPLCRRLCGLFANCYVLSLISLLILMVISGIILWKTEFLTTFD